MSLKASMCYKVKTRSYPTHGCFCQVPSRPITLLPTPRLVECSQIHPKNSSNRAIPFTLRVGKGESLVSLHTRGCVSLPSSHFPALPFMFLFLSIASATPHLTAHLLVCTSTRLQSRKLLCRLDAEPSHNAFTGDHAGAG